MLCASDHLQEMAERDLGDGTTAFDIGTTAFAPVRAWEYLPLLHR